MKAIFIIVLVILCSLTGFSQGDTSIVKKQQRFLYLSGYCLNYDNNTSEVKSYGFSDYFFPSDGRSLNPPQKPKKGEKADPNAAQVDHVDPAKPKDKSKPAGSNSNSNLQVLSAEENRKKVTTNDKISRRFKYGCIYHKANI